MTTKEPLDLGPLADYEIVGELSGREDATVLLATRRADQRAVLITIVREPAGDAGNALSHLGADMNLLAGASHPHVVPVLEGRWLGADALAIVTERTSAPTLAEMLTRRDEAFPFTRVAGVLRDVNAALEWARDRRVVHRALRLDTIHVAGSDEVRVSFVVTALPSSGAPGAESDARTIASLARAMLTRSVMDPERDNLPLAEVRPGLPARIVDDTNALLSAAPGTERVPDARGYIAAIAMAEELKRAEDERAAIRLQIEEEQRRIRGELASEREAHDRDLAEQARRFADEREQEREAMSKERERAEQALARERERAEQELSKERSRAEKDLAKARAALDKERRQLAREREAFARDREAFQRQAARSREQIAAKLAALDGQARLYAATSELPALEPDDLAVADAAAPMTSDATPLMDHAMDAPAEPYDEIMNEADIEGAAAAPSLAAPSLAEEPLEATLTEAPVAVAERPRYAGRGPWRERVARRPILKNAMVAVLLLVVLVGASTVALSRRGASPQADSRSSQRVVDSVAGSIAAPLTSVDSSSPDSVAPASQPPASRLAAPAPQLSSERPSEPAQAAPVIAPTDTLQPLLFTRPDSIRPDSIRPDSIRPDTIRRDSVRRDTAARSRTDSLPRIVLPKVDSLPPRRDTTPSGYAPA